MESFDHLTLFHGMDFHMPFMNKVFFKFICQAITAGNLWWTIRKMIFFILLYRVA